MTYLMKRRTRRLPLAVPLLIFALLVLGPGAVRAQAAPSSTIVSLQFDDQDADQYQAGQMLAGRGMRATFFVNSGRIGANGYMTLAQLRELAALGNEIGGHTVSHADLPTLSSAEASRQVCNDRVRLLGFGFDVRNFAYPYGDYNGAVEQVVANCGYNSGRTIGGIRTATSCAGCPFAETLPPADPFATRTPDSIKASMSLSDIQALVTQAEQHGGGWVQIVMHHVCDNCTETYGISPSRLEALLDWLKARESQGTVVRTVQEVIGGELKPGVDGPPPPAPGGGELLQNPSLESVTNGSPDCWQSGHSGTNDGVLALTSDARTGARAAQVTISSFTSGDHRLLSRQDLGQCAPAVQTGHSYTLSTWYKSDAPVRLVAYLRSESGGWAFWAQSPAAFPASATYAQATWTTPAVPTGAIGTTGLSCPCGGIAVAVQLRQAGTFTADDLSLVDADQTAPSVAVTAPADGATVSGEVTLAANASDASGIRKVEFLVNGAVVGTATSAPYEVQWDASAFADPTAAIAVRATDTAGNVATSDSVLVTVHHEDTAPPATTIACNGEACSSGWYGSTPVMVSLSASDNVAVAGVYYTLDGSEPTAEAGTPYDGPFSVTESTTVKYRAVDTAGNVETTRTAEIRIDEVAPSTRVACNGAPCVSGWYASSPVSVALSAADNAGGSGVTAVYYTLNGTTPTSASSTYTEPISLAQTTTVKYRAVDAAGNLEAVQTVQVRIDTITPTVAITSPKNGSKVTGNVAVKANASDNAGGSGVARVRFYADGVLIGTDTTGQYQAVWNTKGVAKGQHTLTAVATDVAGNTSTATVKVTI